MSKKFNFKLDKDKIKLQLRSLGKYLVKKKKNFRGAVLIVIFFALLGFGYAVYTNDSGEQINVDQGENREMNMEEEQIFYNNPVQREEEFSLNYSDVEEGIEHKREQDTETEVEEDNTEGVVTEPVKPVSEIFNDEQGIELIRPVSGQIEQSSGWYYHSVLGDWRYKKGIEITGKSGEIVMAAAAGNVTSIKEDPYNGIVITLDHGEGWQTEYGHLQRVTVSPGEEIAKGQEIGRLGSTGITEGPSLYFNLANQQDAIDPVNFFER